ncbi:hypothetical protein P154DRAFT_296068 [Amniculicola lignicola CBS 123094]|uniref:Uncharacterized protein n=1 Tax=Amniculicola lignicola CBS 123094 TaxID=1392246 RepID=A0A6A5W5Q8_9PLEO|nr:hypothetical protein P154DRAFT_296068 [Amniculicola lignicola CBS 123094]
MFRSRRFCVSLVGVVACSTTAADAVFSIIDAVFLSKAGVPFAGAAIAASALDVAAFFAVATFSVQVSWKRDGVVDQPSRTRSIITYACPAVSTMALAVSLASAITIKANSKEVTSATTQATTNDPGHYLTVQFIFWALACLSCIVLYSSPLWRDPSINTIPSGYDSGPRDSVMSEMQTTNLHMMDPTIPSSPLAGLPSPTFGARSSQSLRSLRDSLHSVVRPVTSCTKLINRPSPNRDSRSVYSNSPSVENVSQSDGFDTWDTSSVDRQARDAVLLSAPSRGTVLETIPGSRPPSPARALDGPFPAIQDDQGAPPLTPPPIINPDNSRPPSPALSEAHIHPLFRAESPVPPPTATPGTNILASPLSGQVIPRPFSRMRSDSHLSSTSRAASPAPLANTQTFNEHSLQPRRSSRSLSPPSRGMTPPIPDFVLNSSPRSSLSGTRRKVNLHIDTSP